MKKLSYLSVLVALLAFTTLVCDKSPMTEQSVLGSTAQENTLLKASTGIPGLKVTNGIPPWRLLGNEIFPSEHFLGTRNNADLVIKTNNTERMRVTSGGNVGIGTSDPKEPLHVVASEGLLPPTFGEGAIIQNNAVANQFAGIALIGGEAGGAFIDFGDKDNKAVGSINYQHSGDNMRFATNGGQTRMIIAGDGNVGIGPGFGFFAGTPQGQLDVNGSIFQRGGLLHADYVFEPDYQLESIEEHSDFMWNNKHLKAIPKAKMDENGREIVEVGSHRRGIVEELEKAHIYLHTLVKV